MKYKVNDLIVATMNYPESGIAFSYLYRILSHSSTNYIAICMASDDFGFHAGMEVTMPISSVDRAQHICLAFDKTDEWVISYTDSMFNGRNTISVKIDKIRPKCSCDKFQVIHFGCKCGGC